MKKSPLLYVAFIVLSMILMQCGNTFARGMGHLIAPAGTALLRLGIAAIFVALFVRPWNYPINKETWLPLLYYSIGLGFMALFTYYSIDALPLGIAVALQFSGPLGVALLTARTKQEYLWLALALVGLCILVPFWDATDDISGIGVIYALLCGLSWGVYLIMGKKVSQTYPPLAAVSWAMLLGSVWILPLAIIENGAVLLTWPVLEYGALLALIATVIPYPLELMALKELPSSTSSTVQSLHPVVGALFGMIFLNEYLNAPQWFAILCIMIASIGCTISVKTD